MNRKMKKHFIAFMMPFLTLATGFAQEAAQDVPVNNSGSTSLRGLESALIETMRSVSISSV